MGAVGRSSGVTGFFTTFKDDSGVITYDNITYGDANAKFDAVSNSEAWRDSLSDEERDAIDSYVMDGYEYMNKALYQKNGNSLADLSDAQHDELMRVHEAINEFELKSPIQVTRACGFRVFGAPNSETKMSVQEVKDYLKTNGNILQNDGFLSASTKGGGNAVNSAGVLIRYTVPPSVGAGAWLDGMNPGEREFIFNANSVFRYHINSAHMETFKPALGKAPRTYLVINADWIGRADKTTGGEKLIRR